jgi:uncharacterized protein (TIGR03437 family)
MSPDTPNRVLIPAGARKLVRSLSLLFLLAIVAAAASPDWTQLQELTESGGAAQNFFGNSVSVSGNTAVVGAPRASNGKGAAYVYVLSGGTWSPQQALTASDGAVGDNFCIPVSVSGDTVLIGAAGHNYGTGAAYVFVRSGGVWTQQQELTVSDAAAEDYFGRYVSVSGDTAVIGNNLTFQMRAAYVFVRSGGVWRLQQKLTASGGAAGDYFGSSVSVSGDTVLIGASGRNNAIGAAYVFVRSGGVWSQQQELTAPDGAAGDYFGNPVSVSGDTALMGASGRNGGIGAAYVFVRSGGVWSQQQELTASGGTANDSFPQSAVVSGGAAVIGAATRDGARGAAYVFARSGGTWSQQQELTASDSAAGNAFGGSVSVDGSTVVIGSTSNNDGRGAAYVFATTQPLITGLGVSGGGANIAQNAWIEIYGANLAPSNVGVGGIVWGEADFVAGQMPTELQHGSVTVNGKPAYIYYMSPAQLNVLTPLDATLGPVSVMVNNASTTSAAYTANLQTASPGFLRFGDGIHIAAEHADGSYLGPASMSVAGYAFTPAKPGEIVVLFGDGFGLPVTTLTPGSEDQWGELATWPQVSIGGATASVQWAGVISPGLYQINVTMPSTATTGDNQVIATYAGASSPAGAMIPVAQ